MRTDAMDLPQARPIAIPPGHGRSAIAKLASALAAQPAAWLCAAVTVGLMFRKRFAAAAAVMAALTASFWLTPVVQPVQEHWLVGLAATFDKIAALILIAPLAFMMRRSEDLQSGGVKTSALTFTQLLIIAFIGNEADNALGNLVFAFPVVHNGIFGFTLETTRWAFLVSPFAYPIIRSLQALLAAVVGLPLMRALEARGWV